MKIWIDGSGALLEGQKGKAVVVFENGRKIIVEFGNCTNNEAEYLALIEALKNCDNNSIIYTDSKLLVGQLKEGWKVKAQNLKPLYKEAKQLLEQKRCMLIWIEREYNKAGKLIERLSGYRCNL